MEKFKVSSSIVIDATSEKVWDVLTNPEKIKIYLGGPETITDWKVQSPIIWQNEHGGVKYQDKGKVVENIPEKILKFEYWFSFGGYEDKPGNYSLITYTLDKLENDKIKFTYHRERIPTKEEQEMFDAHLPGMLESIKEIAEEK